MVLRGLTTIWSLATLPTSRSPLSLIATTLGRMSEPLSLGTTRATLLRTYATHVFVVPRSMPSRMGLSAGMKLTRCYGAPHPRRNKTPSANERHNAQLHQRASIPPPAASLPLPPFPTVRRRTAACRAAHGPGVPSPSNRVRTAPQPFVTHQLLQHRLDVVDGRRRDEAEHPRRIVDGRPRGGRDAGAHLLPKAALVDELHQGAEERSEPLPGSPFHGLLFEQFVLRRQFDAPLLVGRRGRGQLVEEPARTQEQPRLVALLLHHRIRQVQLVLGARDRDVEQTPLLFLSIC